MRDPRAKLAAALCLLVAIGVAQPASYAANAALLAAGLAVFLLVALTARLPILRLLAHASWVLPFTAFFAAALVLSGDPLRAASLVTKAYLSALAILLLTSTTPIERLMAGLERLGAPAFLLSVVLFLYRYLFVIAGEVHRMKLAAQARGSERVFSSAAGAVAVLFARSYQRAEGIHRAMLARGFSGDFIDLCPLRFRWVDTLLIAASAVAAVGLHLAGRYR
jgi:cobalt/nickel transport system permease protein